MARLNKKSTKDDLIQLLKANEKTRAVIVMVGQADHQAGYEQAILDAAKALGLEIKPEDYK